MRGARHLTTCLLCVALLSACTTAPKGAPNNMDDPRFISWYKKATPYMRTAFFLSLCVASGFSRGSVEITVCLSNQRSKARIRVQGEL